MLGSTGGLIFEVPLYFWVERFFTVDGLNTLLSLYTSSTNVQTNSKNERPDEMAGCIEVIY